MNTVLVVLLIVQCALLVVNLSVDEVQNRKNAAVNLIGIATCLAALMCI